MKTLLTLSGFVFIMCWALNLAAQGYDIYRHGFLECYQTTSIQGDQYLCTKAYP